MVRVEHLCFGFDNNLVLKDVTFEVKDGALFAITGRSGTGKTTLARLLCGLLKPVSGIVNVSEQPRMVLQFPERQLFARTVLEDVMYGPLNMGMDEKKAREAALAAMKKLGLGETLSNRSPFSLSGGEKRLAAMAGILAMDPQILVLDEPTAGLDAFGCDALVRILRTLRDEGRTMIVITHDGQIMKELIPDGHLEL